MHKVLRRIVLLSFVLGIITAVHICAYATQSMSGNFVGYTLTGDPATDIAGIAMAQNGRTQSQMGYTEGWCADFVSDCAKIIGQGAAIPFYGGVQGLYNGIINAGGTTVSTPKRGDIVFYNWDHVGIMSDGTNCVSGNMWTSGTSKVENWKYTSINSGSTIRIVRPRYTVATGALDVNFLVNGKETGNISGIGTFDITCAGSTLTGNTDYFRNDLANGASYAISNIKTATGYNYTGLRSGSDALTGTIASGAQRTVWLCFESKTYTISFNANGGTGAPASQTKTHGIALTLSSRIPSRDNYDFLGWSASSMATSATYQPGGQYTVDANGTLYAVWKLKTYTITFDPNGGTVSPTVKTISYGSAYGTLPTPTRFGYNFEGWYTAIEFGSKVTSGTVLTESANQIVYAHWSPMGELALPSAIKTIDEEAFMGDGHISHVVIPASCTSIESKAFANCENLISVRILGKSTTFESDTFEGSPNVVIYCHSSSRAQRLASADGIEFHLIGVASDWVLTDDVPSGAEITDRKWTYTSREYTESASESYSGWTMYDSKITSWTDWSGWQNSEVSGNSDREVETRTIVTGYNMISYCVSGPNGRSYQPSPTYTVRLQHGPYWWSKSEFDSARAFSAGSYFDYATNVAGYVLDGTGYCKWDGSDTGGYVPMFIQNTTYGTQWRYKDAVYTYYYFRDINGESATDPSGQSGVSNVQEWVKYVY